LAALLAADELRDPRERLMLFQVNGVPARDIERINALFRNPIKYRQIIKPPSICASTRCSPKLRA
jgi:hypothetical protein